MKKIDKVDVVKIKNFCSAKDPVKKTERQAARRRKRLQTVV